MPPKFDHRLLPDAPDFSFEVALWNLGLLWVAGIDEAGRGALAGPVAAAAVIFPVDLTLSRRLAGVRDSKQMTALERQDWAERLPDLVLTYGVGFASHQEIDEFGIVPSTRLAVQRALEQLDVLPEHLLVDYLDLPGWEAPQTPLVKGDARSLSIAAASIFAKTARDALLCQYDREYPGYGFAAHKGYGTGRHRSAIERLGFSPIHRRSFHFRSTKGQ
jgi:ribonuclease HII